MVSAVSNVFGIPELLQHILSQLPPLDIIQAQRVCHTWQKLICTSPLLRYRSWLSSSYPKPVTNDDAIPELDWEQTSSVFDGEYQDEERQNTYEQERFRYNVSTHLNPVLVRIIMKHVPDDPRFCFDLEPKSYGGDERGPYYSFRPDVLRDCLHWFEKHEDSMDQWGGMSLYRPDVKKINWEIPCSDDSGIPVQIEATPGDGDEGKVTLEDLMTQVGYLWLRWQESETETHYLSHDAGECDLDQGFPQYCLESSDDEEGDEDDEDEDCKRIKLGTKMTLEEHLEQAIRNACH